MFDQRRWAGEEGWTKELCRVVRRNATRKVVLGKISSAVSGAEE